MRRPEGAERIADRGQVDQLLEQRARSGPEVP